MPQNNENHLKALRHSLAHLLAAAVMELYPKTKRTIGPAIDNGFYFDFDFAEPISEADLPLIEKKMRDILPTWHTFERHELNAADAKKEYPGNEFKHQLIDEFSEEGKKTVSFYKSGTYWDLCKGGHVTDMSQVPADAFKLSHLAGAYWKGDSKNKMLTRIYGLAFENKKALDDFTAQQELALTRDHRKLGKQLDLYAMSSLIGSGLPLYTPRGTVIRDLLIRFSEQIRQKIGFQRVWSPHITKKELYETSGHWTKFGNELFLVKSQETSDQLVMKPMNCPHHNEIYASQPRSYRDLPLKLLETATAYRDEKTGELHGLSRVRSLTQDDSHTYCTPDQVDGVVASLIKEVQHFYGVIGMQLKVRLSLRDNSDKYLGDKKLWDFAQSRIHELAKQNGLDFYVAEGEAAFYGPKIDFMAIDAIGREWQVATVQFDFNMPERFNLVYVNAAGKEERPIMIHCAIMGSFDRFFSVFIEHTAGWFPFWAAPEQVRIVTINDSTSTYVKEVVSVLNDTLLMAPVKYNELRYSVDDRNESLGRKIRDAVDMKVPVLLVVGPKDAQSGQVSVRLRNDEHKVDLKNLKAFLQQLKG